MPTPCLGPHTPLFQLQQKVSDEGAVVAALQAPPGFTLEEMRDHQQWDEHLQDVQRWKTQHPTEAEKQLLSPDQRKLLAFLPAFQQDTTSWLWNLVSTEEGTESCPLYIPHALRHRIIEAAHQFLGHAGITATAQFCRKRVFMLRLVPEVHRAIQHCHPCQVKSQKAPTQKDVHRPSIQVGTPFQVWSMDILGPLSVSSEGNWYLLTLKDVFSKWFEASATPPVKRYSVRCNSYMPGLVILYRYIRTMQRISAPSSCRRLSEGPASG